MRTENSIKNTITGFLSSLTSLVVGFIAQTLFIRILGVEYLGLNGLFSNILTLLSIFELGIGSAIVFNLYRPIANKDKEKIRSLMLYYRKAYRLIALIVLVVGLSLLPFLHLFIGEVSIQINIPIVYVLYVIGAASSYLLSYKRSIIYANQKNYIINLIHIVYIVALNAAQLCLLFFTKNYYLYLSVKIICQIIENIFITVTANRLYPYLISLSNAKSLPKDDEKRITSKVRALFFHKIGGVIVFGTDSILISKYFGVISVGLYANYNLLISSVDTLFNQLRESLTASIGNLIVTAKTDKVFGVFRQVRFINFWIATFSGSFLLFCINPFIKIWLGDDFLLPFSVLAVLVVNYFQKIMRSAYSSFKDSAGIWVEDRFIPLIEATLNIAFSIIFLKLFGLIGVFLGTFASGLVLWLYSYPRFVYKRLFGRGYRSYAIETLGYFALFVLCEVPLYFATNAITFNVPTVQLLSNAILCLAIPNVIIMLVFHKSDLLSGTANIFKKFIISNLKKRNKTKKLVSNSD